MKKYILSICIISTTLTFSEKLENCFGKSTNISLAYRSKLEIGDKYQGGIIAYTLQESDPGYDAKVQHGLIAAPKDQSEGIQWFNGNYITMGATGTAIGTGAANTDTIVRNQGEGKYAAKLCADLVLGDYSDWYLPSKDELNLLYLNKVKIGGFNNDAVYWSSTMDRKIFYAWRQGFYSGSQASSDKKVIYYVRAVRTF